MMYSQIGKKISNIQNINTLYITLYIKRAYEKQHLSS